MKPGRAELAAILLVSALMSGTSVSEPAGQHGNCLELPGAIVDIFMTDSCAYLASGTEGLQIVDVARKGSPKLVSRTSVGSYAKSVSVVGHYAYVTAGPAGWPSAYLHAFDVSHTRSPRELGSIQLEDYPERVFVRDTLAFVADRSEGLQIISVSQPDSLSRRGFLDTPGTAIDVLVAGPYAFVADEDSGLRVIDISTVAAPREMAFLPTPGPAIGLCLSQGRLFVAAFQAGVLVVDVTNPISPVVLDTLRTAGPAIGVAVDGSMVYVAEGTAGVEELDVSHLESPRTMGVLKAKYMAWVVRVQGRRLWLADIVPLHGFLQEGPSEFCGEVPRGADR